jgi:hypothetical protein
MLAALAASTSAATLPGCRIGDMPTEYRAVKDWDRSILDTYSRLATTYAPGDLRSTAYAGLNGGQSVRTLVIPDLRALAAAARSAGARLAVQSAYRSYTTQAYTFRSWVGAYGYAAALLVSARPGHSEHQLGTTIDFKSYGGAAPWYYSDWGDNEGGRLAEIERLEVRLRHVLPKGQDQPHVLRLRAVALPLRRSREGCKGPCQWPDAARVSVAPADHAATEPTAEPDAYAHAQRCA